MKNTLFAIIGVVGFFAVIGITLVVSYASAVNSGVAMEEGIKAAYEESKNVLGQYGQKVKEAAQVPDMQRDDLERVMVKALDARYGSEGSKALFQAIAEQNPQLDSSVYQKIQLIIESGRNDFKNSQTLLIDRRRDYATNLGSFWSGFWLDKAGYPKINLDEQYLPVTTASADETFKRGYEDGPIKLR